MLKKIIHLNLILILMGFSVLADDSVTLKGILITATAYGPPNYGENPKTDSKEIYDVLKLEKSLKAFDQKTDFIQVVNVNKLDLKKYEQKKVILKGVLFEAITGHHHTPVLIDLESINLVN